MNITGSPLAAYSSLLSHCCYCLFFFAISALSLFSFKCMFDVILFCLLRTSENFQKLRRSLTTNKVSVRMIEDVDCVTRSCLWSKSRRRQSILSFSNPLTSMICNPTVILNVLGFSIVSLFLSWNYGLYSLYVYVRSVILCSSAFLLLLIYDMIGWYLLL